MTPLRTRMIEDMKMRNLSPHTQRVYVSVVARFAAFFHKSPEQLAPEDVRTYLLHIVHKRRASWSFYIQTLCALRFLYHTTLGLDKLGQIEIPAPPIDQQRWFDRLQAKVHELRSVLSESKTGLDALLPAALDRAFKGQF